MQKRGQITTFIIIGIIILAIVSVVLYFRGEEMDQLPREAVSPDVKPVQLFVEECIQKTAVPGIFLLGQQGGKIYSDPSVYSTTRHSVAYGFQEGNETLPTIQEMQSELSKYLKNVLPLCTNGFENFKNQGIEVNEGEINVDTKIFQKEIVFIVDYPLEVIMGESKNKMQNFMTKVPVKLGEDRSIAQQIIEKSKNGFNMNELITPGIRTTIIPSSRDTSLIAVRDQETILDNRTFVFMFAYGVDENRDPELNLVPIMAFETGKQAYLRVEATDADGDNIRYSSNSSYFSVNPETGEIDTVAPAPGEYDVKITAEDGKGGIAEEFTTFIVLPQETNRCTIVEEGPDCEA